MSASTPITRVARVPVALGADDLGRTVPAGAGLGSVAVAVRAVMAPP